MDLNEALARAREVRDTYPPGIAERALIPLADAIERVRTLCDDVYEDYPPATLDPVVRVADVLDALDG